MTFGSQEVERSDNIGLVRLPSRQWPKIDRGGSDIANKKKLSSCLVDFGYQGGLGGLGKSVKKVKIRDKNDIF